MLYSISRLSASIRREIAMKSDYDRMMYEKLTGREPNDTDLDRVNNLDCLAYHIYLITTMKCGETITLGYGNGSAAIKRERSPWKDSNPIHDQYQFTIGDTTTWVGNMYGAFDAYTMLWELPELQSA